MGSKNDAEGSQRWRGDSASLEGCRDGYTGGSIAQAYICQRVIYRKGVDERIYVVWREYRGKLERERE